MPPPTDSPTFTPVDDSTGMACGARAHGALDVFAAPTRAWFARVFEQPTEAQALAWPAIARHEHTLLLAPTGSGKTLAAFLVALDELMFGEAPEAGAGTRVLYISPLKALGADIERNLRAPLAGLATTAAQLGFDARLPRVGVRSGDTPAEARREIAKSPPEILITTPESLYLMLTSKAREGLAGVERVIIDEIHVMAGSKRGVHLSLSLERLERLRRQRGTTRPLQRIGLSATQRPLEEVARFLGGFEPDATGTPQPRPVTIVDAGRRRAIEVSIEVPAEDLRALDAIPEVVEGNATVAAVRGSVWPAIHPRLLELVRAHRATMVFVNSRRLAERIAAAVNELAGDELVAAHHGSVAKEARAAIEERLKRGELAGLIATSSLELGIDMGAVDLVIQIEAPPTLASGLQRIGRSGHRADAASKGVLIPKYRADLLACAAAARAMLEGQVEATRYPRNALDVLAQQVVAACAMEDWSVDDLWHCLRGAAPYAELPRSAFEGVLDLLAGRYPSEAFAELRPRITWDRQAGRLSARQGAGRIAIINAGTIPDRGLYGVYLADGEGGTRTRVGELDEEMVHEARPGEIFLLGASSWRILEITHDRVLVSPAPGEPGRMPFWRGDGPGRPLDFGRAIGRLTRELLEVPRAEAVRRLVRECQLTGDAAGTLLDYLEDQQAATSMVPGDAQLVVERFIDEVGDWRIALLSPFGARVHAPWAITIAERLRSSCLGEVDVVWSDDGIVFRLPESDDPPGPEALIPAPEEVEEELMRALGGTALFATRFRENAARALLLPRRSPTRRQPLWAQRRRAADLLAVASRFERFPMVLETYRECLRDVFDLDGLREVLAAIQERRIAVSVVDSRNASPFAASLLFGYVANFLYEGDTPLAERRAQALALDPVQLRELLGTAELRQLLDAGVVEEVVHELAGTTPEARERRRDADAVHDLLLAQGDLTLGELQARVCEALAGAMPLAREAEMTIHLAPSPPAGSEASEAAPASDARVSLGAPALLALLESLAAARRVVPVRVNGEARFIAAEDAARYRDALGVVPPPGLPAAFLEEAPEPLIDILGRKARLCGPFTLDAFALRYGIGTATVRMALEKLVERGRLIEGEFLPGGQGREWCEAEALRRIKRRSLARLRAEVEPVDAAALARFLPEWQGLSRPRRGLDGLLDVVEQLQGCPIPASVLEREVLPARVEHYGADMLDRLCAAGEVVWQGVEPIGSDDGRIALYLADAFPLLARPAIPAGGERVEQVRRLLMQEGALFFADIQHQVGGFPKELLEALWALVWNGEVSNDTLVPLRALRRGAGRGDQRSTRRRARTTAMASGFRSRRLKGPEGSEGRWSLLPHARAGTTPRQAAIARQLLARYGVLTREAVAAEGLPGGFAGLYPVLKSMEEGGQARRGYFIAGLGAAQFSEPGAADRLRERPESDADPLRILAATDPANPWGAALRWPVPAEGPRPTRAAGARVALWNGELLAWLPRGGGQVVCFELSEPSQAPLARERLLRALTEAAPPGTGLAIGRVDGREPFDSVLAEALAQVGFVAVREGALWRPPPQEGEGSRISGTRRRPAFGRRTRDPFASPLED